MTLLPPDREARCPPSLRGKESAIAQPRGVAETSCRRYVSSRVSPRC